MDHRLLLATETVSSNLLVDVALSLLNCWRARKCPRSKRGSEDESSFCNKHVFRAKLLAFPLFLPLFLAFSSLPGVKQDISLACAMVSLKRRYETHKIPITSTERSEYGKIIPYLESICRTA